AVAYGGYYNFEPDSIGADYASYSLDENDEAYAEGYMYRVDLAADYVVSNATRNVYYSTLQAAIDAAESGDTIQLLASIEENVTIGSNQNIVLDLNGYTLERTIGTDDLNPVESPVITVEGTLELQDSSADETGMVLMSSYTDSYGSTYSRLNGYGGGVYIEDGGSFTLTGGTISGDGVAMTIEGGGVAVASGGAFTMNGGTITGFKVSSASMDGGGVYVAGTFTMNGGSITDNESGTGDGGGVYVTSGGSFTLTDGDISGNSAHDFGAGVFNNGTFVMIGGSIKDNSVTHTDGDGGGVFNAMSGVFTISGGSITGNSDVVSGTFDCGGVYNVGTMNVSGSPVIDNNVMNNSVACNVYLTSGSYITLADALTEGASIGVTTQTVPTEGSPVQITTAESGTSYYAPSISYFTSDNDAYVISTNESGYLQLGYEEKTYVAQIFDTLLGDSGTKYETLQEAIDAAGSDAYFTTVKLLTDVDEGITVATDQEVILDLNGFDLTNSDASVNSGYAIDVDGGTLTLDDGAGGSVITGSGNHVVKIHSSSLIGTASFTMNGATISGGTSGGIYIQSGSSSYKSTVVINGGSISDNSGNGIYANYATITMNDGSITGNGRGLYLSQYSTLTMNGGSISNNSTSDVGGGVCMSSNSSYNNKFVMNGGVITGNTASTGGGVYAVTRSNTYYFQMNGGAIYGNTATSSGNDIYATNVNVYT
ncbi:MAG: right-handed parallel beta-helix repeat-containing protein, partial [Clostridiales bacterium]|nr:right-handed parallel beta-helix repeat-containing protein [Clostridiales bacterium]